MHFGRCRHEAALAAWEPGAGSTQQGQIGRGLFMLPSSPLHLPAPLTITFICRWLVGERCRLWPGAARANRLPEDPSPGLSLISVLWFPNVQVSRRFSMPRRDLRGGGGYVFPNTGDNALSAPQFQSHQTRTYILFLQGAFSPAFPVPVNDPSNLLATCLESLGCSPVSPHLI